MQRLATILTALALASTLVHAVSPRGSAHAQERDGEVPAPLAPERPAAEPAKSDPAALEILTKAAARQGGAALAEPGGLASFRIEFGRVKVTRKVKQDDGTTVTTPTELDALAIDWLAGTDDAKPSLKTRTVYDGKETVRAVLGFRGDAMWLWDGQATTPLTKETHEEDVAEVELHRRLSRTLVDVAVLGKLLTDGSRWTRVEDATYAGIALRRTPPADASDALSFTLWLKEKNLDPLAVRVDPIEEGAATLHYRLSYIPGYPEMTGAKIRFPQRVTVLEQLTAGEEPRETVDLYLRSVAFNTLEESAFAPPRKKRE